MFVVHFENEKMFWEQKCSSYEHHLFMPTIVLLEKEESITIFIMLIMVFHTMTTIVAIMCVPGCYFSITKIISY